MWTQASTVYRVLLHLLSLWFLRPVLESRQSKRPHQPHSAEEAEIHEGSRHLFAELVRDGQDWRVGESPRAEARGPSKHRSVLGCLLRALGQAFLLSLSTSR